MIDFLKNISLMGEDIPSLAALRQKGKLSFKALPTKKTEAFKYTPVQNIFDEAFDQNLTSSHECCCKEKALPFKAHEIHFCSGEIHDHFKVIEGAEQMSLLDAFYEHEAGKYIEKIDTDQFPFAALNTAYMEQGLFLRLFKTPDLPIAFVYHNKENKFCNIRNIVVVEKGVEADLIEVFEGFDKRYVFNIVNEFFVLKESVLKHYKLQRENINAVHIALNYVHIKKSGKYESYAFHNGAKLCRNETHVVLKEEGAEAVVNAAYDIKGETLIDTTTDIEHLSPLSKSNQSVRGVIDERAHGVFQGKIHIASNAYKTEGYQIHKALMLSDEACVDVKPELEIFADDVKCSHGAASKDLDENELFYLRSRGIDEKTARLILKKAFISEVFSGISNKDIQNFLFGNKEEEVCA